MLYSYTARSAAGEIKSGKEEANSEADLAHLLRTQGYLLTSAKKAENNNKQLKSYLNILDYFRGVSVFDKMLFVRHLSVMIKAGMPLPQALDVLSKQAKNKKLGEALAEINKAVQSGSALSDALSKYPNIFSELFINMAKIGESSGNLEEILDLLAVQMEKDYQLISKIKGAIIYPAVILSAMAIIGVIMMISVVPKLVSTFKDLNITLPATTRFIIAISELMSKNFILGFLAIIILAILAWRFLKTKVGKYAIDWLTLNMPFVNGMIQKVNSARFARTLSSLSEGGVPIVKSLQIVSKTLINHYYVDSIDMAVKEVQKGKALSETLRNYPKLYPLLISQMVEVGEKTGTLSNVLKELAGFYEEDIDNLSRNLASIIEPVLMIIIGGAVGFFALSMIQPIYSMINAV